MGIFWRSKKSFHRNFNSFGRSVCREAVLQRAVIETLEPRQLLSTANIAAANYTFNIDTLAPEVADTSTGWWSSGSIAYRHAGSTGSDDGYYKKPATSGAGTVTLAIPSTPNLVVGRDYWLTFQVIVLNNLTASGPNPTLSVTSTPSGDFGTRTELVYKGALKFAGDYDDAKDIGNTYYPDAVYAFSIPFRHVSGSTLSIDFSISGLSNTNGIEGFGLDNVLVSPRAACPTCFKEVNLSTGKTAAQAPGITSPLGGILTSTVAVGQNKETNYSDPILGNNSFVNSQPYVARGGNDIIYAIDSGSSARTFTRTGTTNIYTGGLGNTDVLTHDTTNKQYVISSTNGTLTYYYDFDVSIDGEKQGKIKSSADRSGSISTTYDGSSHLIDKLSRETVKGTVHTKEYFKYTYLEYPDENEGKVESIAYRTTTWDTDLSEVEGDNGYQTVRTTEYVYYETGSDNGSVGDLQSVTIKDGDDNAIDTTYYRYYKGGDNAPGALKLVVNSASYRRLVAWLDANEGGIPPDEANDSDIKMFADVYYEYDSSQRVSSRTVREGTYAYEYAESDAISTGYNTWTNKTTETLPDGNQNIYYFNAVGARMLSVFIDNSGDPEMWGTYTQFDSQGREVLEAQSSAVILPSDLSELEAYSDLIDYSTSSEYSAYLADDSGLLTFTEYDGNGNVQAIKFKLGDHGSLTTLESMTYTSHTYSGNTVYNIASHSQSTGSGTLTTNYSYSYFSGTNLIESMTTTVSGGATTVVWYNSLGKPIWTKVSDTITYNEYDALTGEITKTIEDVDTDETAEFADLPGGWTNTSGRNFITTRTITRNSSIEFGFNSWERKVTESLPDGSQQIRYLNIEGRVMLGVTIDALGRMWGKFSKFDSQGRTILEAEPSALILPSSLSTLEGYPDLMNFGTGTNSGFSPYIADTSGLLTLTVYDADGNLEKTKIQQGDHGTPITVEVMTYTSHTFTGGNTVYNLATYTQYSDTAESVDRTTSYSYTYVSDTNLVLSMTTTLPTVGISQNGPGTSGSTTVVFDARGNAVWTRDAAGMITYNEYDAMTGELTKTIIDVKYSSLSAEEQEIFPSGWTQTSGFNLVTTSVTTPFGFSRTTQTTDPKGNVTYTVYNEANNEMRQYAGWHAVGGGDFGPTGPVMVSRQDTIGNYSETLTFAYTPSTVSAPTGTESISNIQSLSRTHTNTLGQVDESNNYFNLSGVTYSASFHLGSLNANYVAQTFGYSALGQQNRSVSPNGTITRTVFDALGRVVSTWIGTNDTDATDGDPTGGAASGNNMVKIWENVYDNGGVGDGNLTETKTFPTGSASPRSTQFFYNWRNQLVSTKSGLVYALPSNWADADIGSPSVAGSSTFDGTTFTLNAAGSDIGGTSDQFNFVSRSITGNTTLIARIDSLVNTDAAAKAGLMLRESTAAGSKEAFVYVTPSGSVGFQYRTSTDGSASSATASGATGAIYLKLERSTNTLSASYSTDGTSWTAIGSPETVTMSSSILAGIAATSHDTDAATTVVVDQLSVGGTAVTTESGVHRLLNVTIYNNLGEATANFGFDGDGISMVDNNADGIPDALFDEIYPNGDDDPPAGATDTVAGLVAFSTASYDELGRAFRSATYSVNPETHAISSDAIISNAWFDHRGNVIKSVTSGGATSKFVYDGVGRLTISYITDGGDDIAAGTSDGTENSWTSALGVTGDKVLEQVERTYDANSNIVLTTLRQRFDNAGSTGELGDHSTSSAVQARVSYALNYFDAADRLTATVDVGTNGSTMSAAAGGVDLATDSSPANGIPDVLEGSVPSRSNTILVTTYEYCPAGWLDTVTDPRGVIAKTFFDAMGRTTYSVAAWDEIYDPTGGDKPSATNENQTVAYTYDASGHIKTLTAITPTDTNNQTTVYTYGVSPATGSVIASNDILSAVTYGSQYFAGTSGNDDFVVQLEDGDSDTLEVWKIVGTESQLIASLNYAGIGSLVFDGGAGDDSVTLDLTYGSFELPGVFLISSGTNTLTVDNSSTNSSNVATINSDLATLNDHLDVVVASDARLTFNASQRLQSLTLEEGSKLTVGTASWARQLGVVTENLSIATNTSSAPTATLDLRDNMLVVIYDGASPAEDLEDMVASGRNSGAWDGYGINSSIAAGNSTYAIGIIDNATRPGGSYTLFDGIVVPADAVLIKSTYAGDFTLNGSYDSNDAIIFTNSYSNGQPAYFAVGDINYDGLYSFSDSIVFATVFNGGLPSLALKYSTATAPNQERFRYDGIGTLIEAVDRNGTVHDFSFNALGRVTSDAAYIAPGNHYAVDAGILRIETSYNNQGLVEFITSYDAVSGGNIVNQIQRVYNGLGQLHEEFQSHSGSVNGSTPSVAYTYDSDLTKGSRLTKMTYPNGRVLHYGYESGIDDDIGRLSYLADDNGSGSAASPSLETYSYLGLSTVVSRAHPETGVALTYLKQDGDSDFIDDGGDARYTGIDRFGRVIDQNWYDGSASTDRFQYAYDRNSNVLYKNNLVDPNQSELYHVNASFTDDNEIAYDPLNRLIAFSRGELSSNYNINFDKIVDPSREQSWTLDSLGNMTQVLWEDGGGSYRTHNDQNQILVITDTSSNPLATLAYDAAGNITKDDRGQKLIYDAWNRLVQVNDDEGTFIVGYSVDGAGRRITENRAAVTLFKDIYSGSGPSNPSSFVTIGSTLYFVASDAAHGAELWKTDGTKVGTEMVADIYSGSSGSNPANLVNIDGDLYFTANDGSNGVELWTLDAGTPTRLTDINSGSASAFPSMPYKMGSKLYFAADDGSNGYELWSCNLDGSSAALVKNIKTSGDGNGMIASRTKMAVVGSTLYFFAASSSATHLWKTDGTTVNTERVDTSVGGNNISAPAYVDDLAVMGGNVYFVGNTIDNGIELYQYTGTGSATLIEIAAEDAHAFPANLTVMGGVLFFTANDGTNGTELWKYNGTSASMVADINSGGSSSSNPHNLMAVGSTLFFTADDGAHGEELWKLSGTTASMAGDLNAGTSGSTFSGGAMATNGTTLYFAATTASGHELWQADASSASRVKVISADNLAVAPSNFALLDGDLYFSAQGGSGAQGNELWKMPIDPARTDLYYTAAWQVIEERENGSTDASTQFVYSPVYVNAPILRDSDADANNATGDLGETDSGLEQRIYYQHDANYNVTSILAYDEGETEWIVAERYLYDPYGAHTVTDAEYTPLENNASIFYQDTLYQGGKYDPATGLYIFQRRDYSPALMRWMRQDPLGYVDGMNRYLLEGGNSINRRDPSGLMWPTGPGILPGWMGAGGAMLPGAVSGGRAILDVPGATAGAAEMPGALSGGRGILDVPGATASASEMPGALSGGRGILDVPGATAGAADMQGTLAGGNALLDVPGGMEGGIRPWLNENAMLTIQRNLGLLSSVDSGDYQDNRNLKYNFNSTTDLLLTINGINNSVNDGENMMYKVANAVGISPEDSHYVANGTHGKYGLGDVIQILTHELGAIDLPAQFAALQLKIMARHLQRYSNCGTIHVIAHSQGTKIFERALPLLSSDVKEMIDFHGFGGQKFISMHEGLFSVENVYNADDPVPYLGNHLKAALFSPPPEATIEEPSRQSMFTVSPVPMTGLASHEFDRNYLPLIYRYRLKHR